jgi:hypothetical protein
LEKSFFPLIWHKKVANNLSYKIEFKKRNLSRILLFFYRNGKVRKKFGSTKRSTKAVGEERAKLISNLGFCIINLIFHFLTNISLIPILSKHLRNFMENFMDYKKVK